MTEFTCVRPKASRRTLASCLAVLLLAASASAQTLPPQLPAGPLTLEQVLDIAEARSEAIAAARAGITRSEGERIRARSGLFPQLSVSGSYERALASEFEGVFGSSNGPSCAPFSLNPQAAIETRVAEIERAIDCGAVGGNLFNADAGTEDGGLEDLPFGRENTWRLTLSFSQNLYSGGRNGAQAAVAAALRESANLSVTTARGQLLFDATQAYFDAALSSRLVEIAEATVNQADATLKQVQAGFDAGTQPEFEVLRARVNRDNQTPLLIRQRVNREVALLRLKQLLDLPASYDLQLADSLRDETLEPPGVFAAQVAPVEKVITSSADTRAVIAQGLTAALPRRAAVDSAAADVQRSAAALRLAETQKNPSVTLNSSYGRVAYPSGFFTGFDNFRTNWTLGANVTLPILTGGRQRGDEIVARADVEETRVRLQQIEELAGLDTRLAWAELLAARSTWEASAGTVEQAARAYEIADVRYRAGVSTQLELSDSRLLLQQAEANRAQAARDVQVARARVALLPQLPLNAGGTGTAAAAASRGASPAPQTPAQPGQQAGASGFQTSTMQSTQTQAR